MDYLKFNCFDMTVLNDELHLAGEKMHNLYYELNDIINSLDHQLKSYDNLIRSMESSSSAVLETAERILVSHKALNQIVDLYYAAESCVSGLSEELPDKLHCPNEKTSVFRTDSLDRPMNVSPGMINKGNLMLEDWLSELIYRYGINDRKD